MILKPCALFNVQIITTLSCLSHTQAVAQCNIP